MLFRSVIDNKINDYFDAEDFCFVHESYELATRTMSRIDSVKILDVITVILIRSRLKWCKPDRFYTEGVQVIKAGGKAFKISHAIPIAVHEGFQIETVNNRVLIP